MENNFDYQLVPDNYIHCFNEQCAKHSQCLRYLVGQHSTSQHDVIRIINPKSIPDDTDQCSFFKSNKKVRKAWGIKHLLDNVPHKDGSSMRQQLIGYFDKNIYYRIYRMERGVLPKEQEYIKKLFRENGIAEEPKFERYTEEYNFG